MPQTADAIVSWAEAQPTTKLDAPNKGVPHLTGNDVADILRFYSQGLTCQEIGAKLEPARDASTISRCISRFGLDNTAEAKRILRGGAADMALNIIRKGQAKDHVAALKGLGVLDEPQSAGLSIHIGGVQNIELSPVQIVVVGEGQRIP